MNVATSLTLPATRRRSRRWSPGLVLALFILALSVLSALAPGLLAPYGPLDSDPANRLLAPSLLHPFGTDALGRDVLSRTIHGASLSLSGAAIAVSLGLFAGVGIGLVSGYFGGAVDAIAMRLVDVLLAIPNLLLSMAIVVTFGFGTGNAAMAVGVASIAVFARLTRAEVLRVRALPYVEAARGSGVGEFGIVVRHILPNAITPVLGLAALQFGTAILAIATLGFLGLGTPPPTPEWGLLVAEGRDYLAFAWWLTTLPGLVIVAAVLSASRVAAEIRREHQ
ncbi:ABC transporter permease [Achromobacter veterisilvae]|jgi:peptide/nickel transport system permease protein|uniref:ABC transporter permease n=1 Tax=Achromobacter veterisilvae TaxID=2069367 RepID=A0A446CI71_9BURK|nr:ABC transporter permease [Achromobacter veterisilvae]SSW67580.1 Glutathione transport system permease protein GsiD [Achromobacter veterisilvae]